MNTSTNAARYYIIKTMVVRALAFFACSLSGTWALGQNTVGTLFYQNNADTGYLLMAPAVSDDTWLIDNCGREVHRWTADAPPALSAYLLDDGSLLRPSKVSNTFDAGGSGGRVDRILWDGLNVWTFLYSSDTGHQHHDVQPLPNGNVLVLAWEKHSAAEAIALGRRPETVPDELWSEKIVELRPTGPTSAEFVWSWRLWDHLIQDQDPLKPNFGNPADHPERVDINYLLDEGLATLRDWTHANSVDYHAGLDQILISVRNFHEVWILDHSTTRAEAAGSTGGNSGMGGDLLYRWGNPQAYGRGTAADQVFYQQHDAAWVPEGYPGQGNITVFNNGKGRPEGAFSSVEEFSPPLASDGSYLLAPSAPYGPAAAAWTFVADPPGSLNSKNLSGAQRQRNGNTLLCAGASGDAWEVTPEGSLVWRYVCPVNAGGPVAQGSVPTNNQLFRLPRYSPSHPGLSGRTLLPGATVQIEAAEPECVILNTGLDPVTAVQKDFIHPNPFQDELWINTAVGLNFRLRAVDATGRLVYDQLLPDGAGPISTESWPLGLYVLLLFDPNQHLIGRTTLIKSDR
ncbi:MAG: arylsulfotransferase [Bacteroidetes bacterium]|nr:arylsulfotransferase [Bacteroidota bacterium]